MADDVIRAVVGGSVAILILIIFVPILLNLVAISTEQKCAPYISQIEQKNAEIGLCEAEKDLLDANFLQCAQDLNRLKTEEITKYDVETITQDINLLQSKVVFLNQKFESVNNSITTTNNIVNNYFNILIIVNVFLVFLIIGDFLAVNILNLDLKKKAFKWLIEKIKNILKRKDKNGKTGQ